MGARDGTRRGWPPRGVLHDERGVTLVELMIVVAILAIIAAIAITLYQDVEKRAKLAADQQTTAALASAISIYYGKHDGSLPATTADVLALVTPTPVWQCSVTVTYTSANGKIVNTATLGDC